MKCTCSPRTSISTTFVHDGNCPASQWSRSADEKSYAPLQVDQWRTDSEALRRIRSYNPLSSMHSCPLCVYTNGVLVTVCIYHREIERLRDQQGRFVDQLKAIPRYFKHPDAPDGRYVEVSAVLELAVPGQYNPNA